MNDKPIRTIRGIAAAAGVSVATVSRVINNPESVKPLKRNAVQAVIEQNDYINDGMARALSAGRTRTIGVVIPTIMNSIYGSSTHAIQRVLQKAGYSMFLVVTDFNPEAEPELIRQLVERRVDGIILTGGEHDPKTFRMLDKHDIPCVITWRKTNVASHACVSFDNYAAGRMAMQHLIDLGHRKIGLICGRSDVNDRARERKDAYCDSLKEIGISPSPDLIFERDFEYVEGHAAMHRMLSAAEPPTAVFAANDIQAIGAMRGCKEAGLKIPEDISIIGFDDLPVSMFCEPKLTTIHVPANELGHLAATRLLQLIDQEETNRLDVLSVNIVVRDSTARPPQPA